MSTLGVVIVNYNSNDFLRRCLKELFQNTTLDSLEVVVVDNASDDRDFSQLKAAQGPLSVILNDRNVGFAAACNQGLRCLHADYYLLLNPDCIVEENSVDRCVEFLQRNLDVGIVGCRVNNPDGSLQLACRRTIPRPSTAFYRFSGLARLFPNNARIAAYNLSHLYDLQSHQVEAVSGSFLMFRSQLYQEIGGLDERFFLYGEDLDFCLRATRGGWKVFYVAEAEVTHYKNVSSRRDTKRSTYHFYEAMELFYRKHFHSDAGRLERLVVPLGIRFLYGVKRARQILFGKTEIGSSW